MGASPLLDDGPTVKVVDTQQVQATQAAGQATSSVADGLQAHLHDAARPQDAAKGLSWVWARESWHACLVAARDRLWRRPVEPGQGCAGVGGAVVTATLTLKVEPHACAFRHFVWPAARPPSRSAAALCYVAMEHQKQRKMRRRKRTPLHYPLQPEGWLAL